MVFEHFAAFFIEKFLGNYIQDFDSHQLKLHLWDGDITLQNVHLKTNALNDLNVPIDIVTGYLEKLKIHIPWTHLYSHPTKIELDGFYLLLSPKTDVNYDPEKAEEEEYQSKMKQVNKVEEFRQKREKYQVNKETPHHKDTFFERLQFHILRNLEIEIKNIHIAFDDKTTKSYPFQFGITLNYIKLNTTNSQWKDFESKEDSKIIYKLGEINNLSIYWNSNVKSRLELTTEEIIDDLKSNKDVKYQKMNYIVQPFNAQAKLKIAKTAQEQDFEEPVLDAQIDFNEIYLNINKNQYSDLLDLLEFQDYLHTKKKYIKYHSIINDNQDQKISSRRWKFAYKVIVNEFVRPRLASFKWENIKENLNRYKEYHQIYFQQLHPHLIKQHKQRIQELEKQIDAFNLIYIRRTAQIEYKIEKIEEKQISWWDKLTNWWSSDSDEPEFKLNENISNEEKLKLYEAIGYNDEQTSDKLFYSEKYIDMNISIKLNLLEMNVWSFINKEDLNLKMISRISIPNTEFQFQRRPSKDDFLLIIDFNSFEMYGIDPLNLSNPILIQPFKKSDFEQNKLLHLEFETNPINNNSDYRINCKSQSLQINYHAMTINKLIECFIPSQHHDLEGIKEAALSIYTDVKNQTEFLVSENLKKIKDLDIFIDLKSIYFILPENGNLNDSCSVICLELGRLTFKGGKENIQHPKEDIFYDAKTNLNDSNESSYVPIEIQLENIQLLCLNQRENWIEYRLKKDSPSHLIKPITLTLNVKKSIIIDNPQIPIWKANGEISSIEFRLSDTRLFGLLKLIETIPLPESSQPDRNEKYEKSLPKDKQSSESTKQIYDTIEQMTPVKSVLFQQEKEEQKQIETDSNQQQIIQLKASFQIKKIDILFERALLDLSDYTEQFLRISLIEIVASAKIETYDIIFNGYLQDFIIIHEQFITNDNQKLNILSKKTNSNFFQINCLLTSTLNPQFTSSPYNSIENNIQFQLNQFILNLQLEAIASIIIFQKNIFNKLNKKKTKSNSSKTPKQSSSSSSSSSFKIDIRLDEISLLIGSSASHILFIQLKLFNGFLSKTNTQIASHLILNDFFVIDLYQKSLYQYIITKKNKSNDLIQFDLSLFNYPKNFNKKPKDEDSFIKGQVQKLNCVFLYKHIDLILSTINSFQTKENQKEEEKEEEDTSSDQQTFISSTLQKYQEKSLKFHLDFILNAPEVFIPFNSYSNQGINIDLGKLSMHTDFDNSSSIEKHTITYQNIEANRTQLNKINKINLFQCSPFTILIDRHLISENNKDKDQINIQIQWDNIQTKLSKSDYASINKIFKENFQEKIFFKIPQIQDNQQQQNEDQQQKQDQSSKYVPKKQSSTNKNSTEIRFNFQIKEISLTLYLDEINVEFIRNEDSKFLCLTIQMIEAFFQQSSDSTSQGQFQIHHLFAEDFKQNSHLINKGFNVDQHTAVLLVTLNNKTSTRKVNGEMESFQVLINPNIINSMKEFVTYEIPSTKEEEDKERKSVQPNNIQLNISSPAKSISHYKQSEHRKFSTKSITNEQPQSPKRPSSSSDIETNVNLVIKPSQLILMEDKNNNNSNCLVFNLSMSMILINNGDDTKISSSIKDLSFFGSNFEELKDSKVKYSVIDPTQIDAIMMMNQSEQKIDLQLGDLAVNIDPILIRTFASLASSIKKQEPKPEKEKEKVNSKSIFDPKPFKDSSFWFLENSEEKENLMEETDLLELTTGISSKKTTEIKQKDKNKSIKKNENYSQQLIIKLNIFEIKLELGEGSSTRPVVAFCLSNIFADIQNWSSDILISSSIEMELALFNDNLLAWEPLIEPIIDEQGIIQSPWTIFCETIQNQQDQNDEQYRYLLNDDEKDLSNEQKSSSKENEMNLNFKKLIFIRAENLLNITLTKTTLDLIQRLQKMFNDVYQKGKSSDSDKEQSMLSIYNQTGYQISIQKIIGVEFPENKKPKEELLKLENNKSLELTIPDERINATHLPAINEQVEKRKQQFQLQIEDKMLTIDINQTWKRVYEISLSSNPNWPIQLLCDSRIYQERRRIILSSIIKISNRTEMPLIILDIESIETKKFNRVTKIDVDQEFYLPIQLLYLRSASRLYFTLQQDNSNEEINDFMSFDWANESTTDRILKLNDGRIGHFVIYKEEKEAYSENTDEPIRKSFNIYIKLALHVLNLLPIPIECLVDNIENFSLKPSEIHHCLQGHKKSILIFTIPSYNNSKWISESIDLNTKGHGIHNEHIVNFYDQITNEILRMVLRVDTYRGSYRLSFYSPFWIVNATDLKFQFKIEHEKTFIDVIDQPYFICPKKFDSEEHKKKGYLRLFSTEEDESISEWSEGFSVGVIKSTGIASCKVKNDRNYMICVDIVTSSFGMTKIVTLAPATAIINNSTIDVQVAEDISGTENDQWTLVKSNQIIPYWPRFIKEGVLCVRYFGIKCSPTYFSIKEKHRTLLRMDNDNCPAIHVEVSSTDFDGYKVIFGDYQIGDAPLLIVNTLTNQNISFAQKEDLRTQVLPSQYYVYYTWINPFKPKELIVSSNESSTTIQLNPACGIINEESEKDNIYYAIFHDGPQSVLMISNDQSVIESVSDMPSMSESMKDYVQISFNSIGISIINDISREDLFYISINPSKELWTETRKFNVRPVGPKLNENLEEAYQKYLEQYQDNSNKQQTQNKFDIDKKRSVSFDGDIAEISDEEGHSVHVKRETLDGFWIGYAQSLSNQAVHLKINDIQIDNQLQITLFPTILHPIVSKAAATDIPGKPFIELSIFKSKSIQSNTIDIKYFKLLIQEFSFCADQGLISGIMAFIETEKNLAAPSINMDTDLKRISNPLDTLIKDETDNTSGETKIYLDNLHLSPLKIHVSFSMHGAKASEQLLAEHPIGDFLLQTMNVAEVQDVILKLNCFERKNDQYPLTKLTKEITTHYENQLLKQIHVVVLGLDVLGNPMGVILGVKEGVESFFYEPYKGAMEGPIEFIEGIATGTEYLVSSVVGGAAGAISKITNAASKGLASITLDKKYQNIRIQRKEIQSQTSKRTELASSGKNALKDIKLGFKGVLTKPKHGAKHGGTRGFVKGLGKGFLGLIGRPTSGIADLTSTSFNLIKRNVTNEQIIHRVRHPRHIGRDGLVRPSIAHETLGNYLFDNLDKEKESDHEAYIAHINSSSDPPGLFFATTKRVLFLTANDYRIEWDHSYKEIKGSPIIKFQPNVIEITLKEKNSLGITKKDSSSVKTVPYEHVGEARYIVDKINETTTVLEV